LKDRCGGLLDEARPGPPRTIDDDQVAAVIERTLRTMPADARRPISVIAPSRCLTDPASPAWYVTATTLVSIAATLALPNIQR